MCTDSLVFFPLICFMGTIKYDSLLGGQLFFLSESLRPCSQCGVNLSDGLRALQNRMPSPTLSPTHCGTSDILLDFTEV